MTALLSMNVVLRPRRFSLIKEPFLFLKLLIKFPLCPSTVWIAQQENQEEGQGGYFQVHDSVPGSQPEDAGAVQPRKKVLKFLIF